MGWVKIKRQTNNGPSEKFWVQVETLDATEGTIDNDLVYGRELGLKYGDKITFTQDEVLQRLDEDGEPV